MPVARKVAGYRVRLERCRGIPDVRSQNCRLVVVASERRLERRWGISAEVTQTTTTLVSSCCSARRSCCIHRAQSTSYRVYDGLWRKPASWASILAVFMDVEILSAVNAIVPGFPVASTETVRTTLWYSLFVDSRSCLEKLRLASLSRYLGTKNRAYIVVRVP